MKRISVFLTAMMIFTVGFVRVNTKMNEVVLTADQVSGAPDIESAIQVATQDGTRPGIVTLDSSKGDFLFTEEDRSINIFLPNVTLRSENSAVIQNCADGIYFDGLEADGVTIEGITFHCDGSGVVSTYEHDNVVIRGNTFHVDGYAVLLENATNWKIVNNTAEALKVYAGVLIMNSRDVDVSGNDLTLYQGITLEGSNNTTVINNNIGAIGYGISVENRSSYNRIARNNVTSTQYAGVWLGWFVEYNQVLANRVRCASSFPCKAVLVNPEWSSKTNKIAGNKLLPDRPPVSFDATLTQGWNTFILEPSSAGIAYIADVTPLHSSLDGAHIPFTIKPVYDGKQWNDVLHAFIPVGQPDQQVQITIYDFNALVPEMDVTELLLPGVLQTSLIGGAGNYFSSALLPDLDPQDASVEGATFELAQIYTEYQGDLWWSTLRAQISGWLPPQPLQTRMRVYRAPNFLELVSDFNYSFTQNDTWTGFYIGPASLQRGYVAQMVPLSPIPGFQIAEYRIQPEFNGYEWSDILRVHMENTDETQQSILFNIKIFACDKVICP